MKQLLIIATLLFGLTFITKSQIVENRVGKYLQVKAIDTFLVYSYPCSGQGVWFDSCKYEEPQYLIWTQDGNYYLRKFDYCNSFSVIQIDSINPLTFYLKNKKVIDREKIKQPTYYEYKKNKTKIDTLVVTSMVDHSCSHKFTLPLTRNSKYKYANTYDLDFKLFDNGRKNIYFNYNQKTKFKLLIDLTTQLIKQMETENRFVLE
jgi:hypothetical protein